MKKTTKTKSKSKKPAKQTGAKKPILKMKSAAKSKPAARTKKKIQSKKATAKKSTAKKAKTISFTELYELKKQREQNQESANATQGIPPHELHDKANLQQKAQGNGKIRSGAPGTRHH